MMALMSPFFSQRSALALQHFRQAGLFPPINAPILSQLGGAVAAQPDPDCVRRAVHAVLDHRGERLAPASNAEAWADEFRAAIAPFFPS